MEHYTQNELKQIIKDYHKCRDMADCHNCAANKNISGDITWCWFLNAVRSAIEDNFEVLLNRIF